MEVYRVQVSTPKLRAGNFVEINPEDFSQQIRAGFLRKATDEEHEQLGLEPTARQAPSPDAEGDSNDERSEDHPESAGPPPRNASRTTWADYARGIGIDVSFGMTRNDIIEAVDNR